MPDPIRILLVEDNPADADLTREALEECKLFLTLHTVEDGESCLEYLDSCAPGTYPDMILLDLNLPRLSGREALEEIKTKKALRTIPVIILTSSDAESDIIRSYDLGANCYVTKPLNLSSFISIVRSLSDFWFTIVKLPPQPPAKD